MCGNIWSCIAVKPGTHHSCLLLNHTAQQCLYECRALGGGGTRRLRRRPSLLCWGWVVLFFHNSVFHWSVTFTLHQGWITTAWSGSGTVIHVCHFRDAGVTQSGTWQSGMEDGLSLYWSGVCAATQEFSKEKQTANTSKRQDSSRKEASEKHIKELTSNDYSAAESQRWMLVVIFQHPSDRCFRGSQN